MYSRPGVYSNPKTVKQRETHTNKNVEDIFKQADANKAIVKIPNQRSPDYGSVGPAPRPSPQRTPAQSPIPKRGESPTQPPGTGRASSLPSRSRNIVKSPRDVLPKAPVDKYAAERAHDKPTYQTERTPPRPKTVQPTHVQPARTLEDSVQKYTQQRYRDSNNRTLPTGIPQSFVPRSTYTVKTKFGEFEIEDMRGVSHVEIQRMRASYTILFQQLNNDWSHIRSFDPPAPSEDVHNVQVRYLETITYLKSIPTSDLGFVFMCVMWAVLEYCLKKMELPIEGYTLNQISMYKMYKPQLVEIGVSYGVGQDWAPTTKAFVMSLCSALLTVIVAKMFPNKKGLTGLIMKEVSTVICGKQAEPEVSEQGTPKPPTSGLMGIVGEVMGGGGGGDDNPLGAVMGLLGGFLGGGGKKSRKQKEKQKKQKKDLAKEREEVVQEENFDI